MKKLSNTEAAGLKKSFVYKKMCVTPEFLGLKMRNFQGDFQICVGVPLTTFAKRSILEV